MGPIKDWDKIAYLYSEFKDSRNKGKNKVAVFCPVGDSGLLKQFLDEMKKQSFQDFDLILIYRQDIPFLQRDDLSILHLREKISFGTSANFFMGQYISYIEGYEFVIIADIDATPSSNDLLKTLVEKAKITNKVIAPISKIGFKMPESDYFVINQFGTYPRSIFEKYGFITPYYFRGAEDYDMTERLRYHNAIHACKEVFVVHPLTGPTIFHKMLNKNKYYQYIISLIKSHLLLYKYTHKLTHLLKFFLWYNWYYFLGNVFDKELREATKNSIAWGIFSSKNNQPIISITKSSYAKNLPTHHSIFNSLKINLKGTLEIMLIGKTEIYGETITLKESRGKLILGLVFAIVLIPIGFIESFMSLMKFIFQKNLPPYPIYPQNVLEALEFCQKNFYKQEEK